MEMVSTENLIAEVCLVTTFKHGLMDRTLPLRNIVLVDLDAACATD